MHLEIKKGVNRKAQGSVEYLSVVGIALLLLIPATILFTNYTRSTTDEVLANQLSLIGNTLLGKAEEMYVLGEGSWTTVDLNLPDSIESVIINADEDLVINYSTNKGYSQAVFYSYRFPINNGTINGCIPVCALNLNPGVNKVKIEMRGGAVSLIVP